MGGGRDHPGPLAGPTTGTSSGAGGAGGQGAWLSGPATDLLFGYGLAYILTLPVLLYVGQRLGMREWPAGLVSMFALAVAAPHYGATLLRAYDKRADRQRYVFFTIYASVLLALLYLVALWDVVLGSWLLTLYITWSPWHFAGQNYGLAVMSLRRRGVPIEPGVKRLIYASFVLSSLLAMLSLHVQDSPVSFVQGYRDPSRSFDVIRLGIPMELARVLGPALLLGYAGTLAAAAVRLGRVTGLASLAPAGLLVLTQALWFTVPAVAWVSGSFAVQALPFAAIWLSVAHSLQYLWVTSYYARRSASGMGAVPFLVKSMLAGCALSIAPALLFVPGLLGPFVPLAGGATVLLFAVVNLHHFLLDGAIWKLREGSVARILLRPVAASVPDSASAVAQPARRLRPVRALVWAVGVVSLAIPFYTWTEVYRGGQLDGSLARTETAVERLAWFGRDNPLVFDTLGWYRERAGDTAGAIRAYRQSEELEGTPIHVADRLAWLLVVYESQDPESQQEAVRFAERASAARNHALPGALQTLSAAYAGAGRVADARRAAGRALELARREGDADLAQVIQQHLVALR